MTKKHKTYEKTQKNTEQHGPSQRPTLKKQIIGNVFRIVGFQWIPGRGLAAMMIWPMNQRSSNQCIYCMHIYIYIYLYMYMCRWIIPTTFNIETANNHSTEAARLWCAFPSFAPWMPWMPWMCWMCWLMLLGCPASPGLTFASKSHGHQLYVPWTVAQVSDC